MVGCLDLIGQSAIGQLQTMTGKKIQRFQGSSTYLSQGSPQPSPNQQMTNFLTGMFGGMLSQAIQPGRQGSPGLASHDANQAEIEARLAQQKQEFLLRNQQALRSWAQNYANQLNQQLLTQRSGSAEDLSAAQSSMWNGGLRPPGGDPMVVDLSDARAMTPSLPGAPPPISAPVSADDVLKRRAEAQARLQQMMAENGDLKTLGQRFYDLEAQLDRLKKEAQGLGADGRELAREHDAWGAQVNQAVQNSLERGTSLLTGCLIPKGTAKGLEILQRNPEVFNGTVESISQLHNLTDFVTERADQIGDVREAMDWVQAKRSLNKDLDYIASNLGKVSKDWNPVSIQWKLGKNIVGSGLDVAQELDAWGNQKGAAGDQLLLRQKQGVMLTKMTALVGDLRTSREILAARLGVRPEDLIPVQAKPQGLASPVAPL
jgi:hypothetical protein